jgi:hypothetical protein
MDHQRHFPDFAEAVRARLMKGAVVYEDRSFSKDPADLLEELRQEALDLAGWGFVLYCRLQAMTEALEASATAPGDASARSAGDSPTSYTPRQCQDPFCEQHDSQPPGRMVGADRVAP